jgi:N-acyl-D-amino-acid deacylase
LTLTLVIRNGNVHDGEGSPPRAVDVGIAGDRVAVVGEIPTTDVPSIDATGLTVAPGFINVLSQAWQTIQLDRTCRSDLAQGVTTEVFGEAVSLGPSSPALLEALHSRPVHPGVQLDFPRLADGLAHVEALGLSVNVASFIGGSNLRALGSGLHDRALTEAELDVLCQLVDEEMADGALGIGTALIYAPGSYATTQELVRLCAVVARHDGLYISHLRSEGDRLLECLDELLDIGTRSSCRVEAYHLKAAGSHNHHKMRLAVEAIDRARDRGMQVSADMYPYTAGATALAASIPARFHDGGLDALLARLADPATRAQVASELCAVDASFENLFLGAEHGHAIMFLEDMADGTPTAGTFLPEVAQRLDIPALADALIEVVRRDPTMMVCYFGMSEQNVQLGLTQPWVSICSDAEAFGPYSTSRSPTHPRAYGSFARILGHYSRDLRLFPLEEAIRKMTSLPADTLRLKDRGRLRPGGFADVVIFDSGEINDLATYEDSRRYAIGVRHVLVNGEAVLRDGNVLESRAGRRLGRGR